MTGYQYNNAYDKCVNCGNNLMQKLNHLMTCGDGKVIHDVMNHLYLLETYMNDADRLIDKYGSRQLYIDKYEKILQKAENYLIRMAKGV